MTDKDREINDYLMSAIRRLKEIIEITQSRRRQDELEFIKRDLEEAKRLVYREPFDLF